MATFGLDPRRLNIKALEQKKLFSADRKTVQDIKYLHKLPPYYGWVRMGARDIYMYLNGKDDGVAMRWFWLNEFESTSLFIWEKLSHLFETIIDVGAHTGCYSLAAAQLDRQKKIVAVEPLPVNLSRLSMNIEYNGYKNIDIFPAAAFSENTSLAINNFNSYSYCVSGSVVSTNVNSPMTSQIQAFRIDDLPEKISRRSLIKIDTEGTENHVVAGASDFLQSRSWFLCESTNFKTAEVLDQTFRESNYTFFVIDDEKGCVSRSNSLSPCFDGGKLSMNLLNRLVVPTEDVEKLPAILSK